MADEKLEIDITAKDDASKVIDPLTKKVDKLEQSDPTVDVKADTGDAQGDVDTFARKLEKLSADDQVVMLTLRAGAAETELKDLMTDLATIDASDPTVDVKIDRVAELSDELGQIKQTIGEIDATALDPGSTGGAANLSAIGQSAGEVKDRLRDVERSSDAARSAMANFAGNAISELPGVSGAIGPVNQLLGEMGEKIAEGDLKFAAMAEQAGPMAAIGVALVAINGYMRSIAESKAFRTQQVDGFTKAIREGDDAARALAERIEAVGKVQATIADGNAAARAFGRADTVRDITGALTELGLTIDQYSQLVTGSKDTVADWAQTMIDAGADVGTVNEVIQAVAQAQEDYATAQTNAATANKFFGETVKSTTDAADAHTRTLREVRDASREAAARANDLSAAADRVEASMRATTDQVDALKKSVSDDQAYLDLQTTFDNVRESAKTAWDETAKGADDAAAAVRANKSDVNDLKQSVIDYGAEVLGLPPSKLTEILAELDQGDVDHVEDQLRVLTRNRQINIEIIAKGGAGYGPLYGPGGTPAPRSAPAPAPTTTITNNYLAAAVTGRTIATTSARHARINGR